MKKKRLKLIIIVILLVVISSLLTIKKELLTSSAIKQESASDRKIEFVQSASQGLIVYANNLKKETIAEEDLKFNTEYLQELIDNVSTVGGGTVHLPAGIYYFTTGEYKREDISECVIKCRDNVLVEGEGTDESTGTVLKPYAPNNDCPVDMFYFNDYAESDGENKTFLKNADFKNFVIDGENAYANKYTSAGKGFMINLLENCDFENVVVKNTDATGFGVDCPINCTIKNCIATNCGKKGYLLEEEYGREAPGASGFGIGTGYSNEESIFISNSTATGNYKYGFFFEHQSRFGSSNYNAESSKGFVVSNCSARGNRYDFGGVRANDVTYENCVSYSDKSDENTVAAIHFEEYSVRTHLVNCETNMQFLDVSDTSAYYYEPVYWAVKNLITTGITRETFEPERICTRAQAVMFLWRMAERAGEVVIGSSSEISQYFETGYEDVPNTVSYVDAVKWAKEKGIIEAGTNFYPSNDCTRAEFIDMLWKYAGKPMVETKSEFSDIEDGDSCINAVNWAFEKGIVTGGSNSNFFPNVGIKRGDFVTILYRFSNSNSNFPITYNLNGGKLENSNPIIYESGKDEFTLNNPTKTGYEFLGWTGSSYSEYVTNNYIPKKTVKIIASDTGNRTYTANWTVNKYTVLFDANDGTGNMDEELFSYDMPQVLLPNKFTRTGYLFLGWNTKNDGTGVSYNDQEFVMNLTSHADNKVILYAQWEPVKYTITCNLDGGTAEGNPIEYTIETEDIVLKQPTKMGNEFLGWTGSNGEETQKEVKITKGTTGNLTYTANWKVTITDQPEKLEIQISYEPKELTNQNVRVIISANNKIQEVTGWELSEDKKSISKIYEENTEETVIIKDEYMNETKQQIVINNIDKVPPQITIEYIEDNNTINVVVKSNKELQELNGWEISNDKKMMRKTYLLNHEEEITFLDLAGNETKKTVKIDSIKDLDNDNINDDNANSNSNNTNNNDINKEDKTDSTTADKVIPNAGKNYILGIAVSSLIIGAIAYLKIKKYREIN